MALKYSVEKADETNTAEFGSRWRGVTLEIMEALADLTDGDIMVLEIPEGTDPKKFRGKIKSVAKDQLGKHVEVVQIPGNQMKLRWGEPPVRREGAKPPGRPKKAESA